MTELENVAKYKDCFNIIRDEIEKKNWEKYWNWPKIKKKLKNQGLN